MKLDRSQGLLFGLAAAIWLLAPATQSVFRCEPEVQSPLVAPSGYGERIFSSAYVILEHMGWWLWPFGRDWVLRPLEPQALFAINLLFWLILVLMLRHAWRLRRWNPWVFGGLAWAVVWLIPFSGIFPTGWPPFSELYTIVAGLGLAVMMASLMRQCGQFALRKRLPKPWRATYAVLTLGLAVWVGALAAEDIARHQRNPTERIRYTAKTEPGNAPAVAELARIEARAGNTELAETLILRVSRAAPWYREIPYIKAEILLARGETAAAQHYLDNILREYPDDERALALRKDE